jgi:hypothetical protein
VRYLASGSRLGLVLSCSLGKGPARTRCARCYWAGACSTEREHAQGCCGMKTAVASIVEEL